MKTIAFLILSQAIFDYAANACPIFSTCKPNVVRHLKNSETPLQKLEKRVAILERRVEQEEKAHDAAIAAHQAKLQELSKGRR